MGKFLEPDPMDEEGFQCVRLNPRVMGKFLEQEPTNVRSMMLGLNPRVMGKFLEPLILID